MINLSNSILPSMAFRIGVIPSRNRLKRARRRLLIAPDPKSTILLLPLRTYVQPRSLRFYIIGAKPPLRLMAYSEIREPCAHISVS